MKVTDTRKNAGRIIVIKTIKDIDKKRKRTVSINLPILGILILVYTYTIYCVAKI